MEDVVVDEVKNEIIDKKVWDCYYNISKYYNRDSSVIEKFLNSQ